ncbi:MAG: DUF1343 domain-containing protein [Candidatus Neomarinimicrobiota bacterium]
MKLIYFQMVDLFRFKKNAMRLIPVVALFSFFSVAALAQSQPNIVQSGLDRVVSENFAAFTGKKIGIVCNHTACDKNGQHIVDLFHRSGVCKVTAIFGPEHGFRGAFADGSKITNEVDSLTGATIYSLYGKISKPTREMLADVDILVYDIQDVGARFYTYISTLTNVMESAAENGIPLIVLDRPNPIRGDLTEGPILDPQFKSFVGPHAIPIRYGLTPGELARLINGEHWLDDSLKAELTVIELNGWQRSDWYDQTKLPWIAPSPNMKTIETATVYPGFCLIEGTNLSEGRGTAEPFLTFGAPWIDKRSYSKKLNSLDCPGVTFKPVKFTPRNIPGVASQPKYEGQICFGVRVIVTDRDEFRPVSTVARILSVTRQMYPDDFKFRAAGFDRLCGGSDLRLLIESGQSPESLIADWNIGLQSFEKLAEQYKIYR